VKIHYRIISAGGLEGRVSKWKMWISEGCT